MLAEAWSTSTKVELDKCAVGVKCQVDVSRPLSGPSVKCQVDVSSGHVKAVARAECQVSRRGAESQVPSRRVKAAVKAECQVSSGRVK